MTRWRKDKWDENLSQQLGRSYHFMNKEDSLKELIFDYHLITENLRKLSAKYELYDYSPLVLTVCKVFEGMLKLMIKEMKWDTKFGGGKRIDSVRRFILNNRKKIESEIDSNGILSSNDKQKIKDKLFSVVNEFDQRHKIAHFGNKISFGEIRNYDSILTKIRELFDIFIDLQLIKFP